MKGTSQSASTPALEQVATVIHYDVGDASSMARREASILCPAKRKVPEYILVATRKA
jgi:hypothetical protein